MAEHPRIHPVDMKPIPPPTPTLIPAPSSSTNSVKELPSFQSNQHRPPPAPPLLPPVQNSGPRNHPIRGCCRCVSWTISILVLFIIILVVAIGALYLIFTPKVPNYSVNRLHISAFSINFNLKISATFDVAITATNPNDNIGIYYVDGSHLSVWYQDTSLCEGSLPVFYQGHRNTTVLDVKLRGNTRVRLGLISELRAVQQAGAVPLVFKGIVPVKVKLGGLKLWKVKFLVRCDVVVSSLSANLDIKIRSSSCGFKFTTLGFEF